MSKLGSLYISLGSPEGELSGGCCEIDGWAADEIERLMKQQAALVDAGEQLLLYNPKEETVGGVENSFKRTVGACKLQAILNFEQALAAVKTAGQEGDSNA